MSQVPAPHATARFARVTHGWPFDELQRQAANERRAKAVTPRLTLSWATSTDTAADDTGLLQAPDTMPARRLPQPDDRRLAACESPRPAAAVRSACRRWHPVLRWPWTPGADLLCGRLWLAPGLPPDAPLARGARSTLQTALTVGKTESLRQTHWARAGFAPYRLEISAGPKA